MFDIIKIVVAFIVSGVLGLFITFAIGAAMGFWFKFAHFGFEAATRLIGLFI